MKKLKLLLTLIAVSIGSWQGSWARTAPSLPTTKTLESGKVYYLYNVGSDRFLTYDRTNGGSCPWARTDMGSAVKISVVNGTQYSLYFVDAKRYVLSYGSGDYLYAYESSSQPTSESYRFTIKEISGGYTIQRVYQSNQNEYIGYDGRNTNLIYNNLTDGNIVWQLMDETETARFIAKRNLYRALESAEGYYTGKNMRTFIITRQVVMLLCKRQLIC